MGRAEAEAYRIVPCIVAADKNLCVYCSVETHWLPLPWTMTLCEWMRRTDATLCALRSPTPMYSTYRMYSKLWRPCLEHAGLYTWWGLFVKVTEASALWHVISGWYCSFACCVMFLDFRCIWFNFFLNFCHNFHSKIVCKCSSSVRTIMSARRAVTQHRMMWLLQSCC